MRRTIHRHGTFHYSVIQAFFWIAYCAGTGYSSTYLLSVGFENAEIGILIALSGILAALLQPLLAEVIDRSGRRLLKPVIFGGTAAAGLLSFLILLLPEAAYLPAGICFAGNLTVMQLLIPLINSLSVSGTESRWINFGFARAVGSLAYAVISYILGMLIAGAGMDLLSWVRIAAFLAMAAGIAVFPVKITEPLSDRRVKEEGFLKKYPGFGTMMAGCFLLYLCHSILTYYNYQIVLTKGGDEKTYGIVIALAAVLELPVMFGFSGMLKKAPARFWFRLSGAGYIGKSLGALLAGNMAAYCGIQVFQMFAWALISVASVSFVKEITDQEDSTRGQAYVTLSYTAAMACGSLGGGFLLQILGVQTVLILSVCSAAAGTAVLSLGLRKVCSRTASGQEKNHTGAAL